MIKTVFIGNRPKVLEALQKHPSIDLVKSFVIEGSLIKKEKDLSIDIIAAKGHKQQLVDFLIKGEYKLCVSAGCPYVIKASLIHKEKILINCHPSVLPFGKGMHPLNECFLSLHQTFGVTVHYLIDELDAGDIIEQVSFPITDDMDVSLLYGVIFDVEAELLIQSVNKLIYSNFNYVGTPQIGSGTYFSRTLEQSKLYADQLSCDVFIKNVRAYSSRNLGVYLITDDDEYLVYSAKKIINPFFLSRFDKFPPGSTCIKTKDVVLVKLIDGLARLDSWCNPIPTLHNKSL